MSKELPGANDGPSTGIPALEQGNDSGRSQDRPFFVSEMAMVGANGEREAVVRVPDLLSECVIVEKACARP